MNATTEADRALVVARLEAELAQANKRALSYEAFHRRLMESAESDAAGLREENRALRAILHDIVEGTPRMYQRVVRSCGLIVDEITLEEARKALAPAAPANGGAKL